VYRGRTTVPKTRFGQLAALPVTQLLWNRTPHHAKGPGPCVRGFDWQEARRTYRFTLLITLRSYVQILPLKLTVSWGFLRQKIRLKSILHNEIAAFVAAFIIARLLGRVSFAQT
jgi:hypothetical protein